MTAPADLRLAVAGVRSGLSLTRVAMHALLERHVEIQGTVLDLGAGAAPSYRAHLRGTPERYLRVDGAAATAPDFVVDLDRDPLPVDSGSVDVVLAFNLLEHLYHHERVLAEARRVLRPAGTLHVWVPFLIGYHPSPEDYFRYTEPALRRRLADAGFGDVTVRSAGGRFTAAANLALSGIPTSPLRALTAGAAVLADRLYYRVARGAQRDGFPLGYLASAANG